MNKRLPTCMFQTSRDNGSIHLSLIKIGGLLSSYIYFGSPYSSQVKGH